MQPFFIVFQDEYEGRAKMVKIADCGDLPLED